MGTNRQIQEQPIPRLISHVCWSLLLTLLAATQLLAGNQKGIEFAQRAQSLMLEHREQDAVPFWKKAIHVDPANATYRNLYGLALQAVGRQEEARREFRRALQVSPKLVDAYSNLGYSLWMDGQETAAEREFDFALKLRPTDANLHFARGLLSAELGEHSMACQHLDLAQPWPGDQQNVWAIISAYGACNQISKATQVASLLPSNFETMVELGKTFLALDQPLTAIQFFERASNLNPLSTVARLSLAEAYLKKMDPESALQELSRLSPAEFDSASAIELRASCLVAMGKRSEAQELFRDMTTRFPDDPKSYVNATQIPLEDQHWDEALELLNVGLARMPRSWLLLFRRGMALKLSWKLKDAREDFVQALQVGGDTLLISAALGEVYASQGDLQGASLLFRKTFEQTGSPEFQLAFALTLAKQGEDKEALAQFQSAAAHMPHDARCHLEYGKMLKRVGQFQQARQELELARSLDPNLAGTLYALSRLYHELGERDLEASTLKEFLSARQKLHPAD